MCVAALGRLFFQHFVAVVGVNDALAAMIVDVEIAFFLAPSVRGSIGLSLLSAFCCGCWRE